MTPKQTAPEPIEVALLKPKVVELSSFLNLVAVMLDLTREEKTAVREETPAKA